MKVVHFIGYNKPWAFHRFADGKIIPHGQQSQDYLKFVQMWWNFYDELRNKRTGHDLGVELSSVHFQTFKHVPDIFFRFPRIFRKIKYHQVRTVRIAYHLKELMGRISATIRFHGAMM